MIDYQQRITIEPGKRGVSPASAICGLRCAQLASRGNERTVEILEDHPELTVEDIRACLAFAANREHQLTKILWFKSGNQPRRYVADALMKYKDQIAALEQDSETTVIEIY
jgi:uncharacterized protein (DUF433 family)